MGDDDDLEIIETEGYHYGKGEENFSHNQLVMIAMRKCIEAGSKEMREGYFNTKSDKFGNINYVYIPDTRKEFNESVNTVEMIMSCDADKDSKKEIGNIKGQLKKSYNKFCATEKRDWESMHALIKQKLLQKGVYFRGGMLNNELPYAVEYLMETVKASRKIFAALTKLTQRLDFFKKELLKL